MKKPDAGQVDFLAYVEAGLPRRFYEFERANFPGRPKALNLVTAFAAHREQEPYGLFLYGDRPCGKTYLLSYLGKLCLLNGTNVAYFNFDDMKELYFSTEFGAFRRTFSSIHILLLDNLTAPKNEGYRNAINRLFRIRSDHGLPTVIASSISAKQFRDYYGLPFVIQNGQTQDIVQDTSTVDIFLRDFVNVNCVPTQGTDHLNWDIVKTINAFGERLANYTNE